LISLLPGMMFLMFPGLALLVVACRQNTQTFVIHCIAIKM